jgi:hypothetical protein
MQFLEQLVGGLESGRVRGGRELHRLHGLPVLPPHQLRRHHGHQRQSGGPGKSILNYNNNDLLKNEHM